MRVMFFPPLKFAVKAYKDLQSRENTRNAAWQRDGWDEIVYYTGITQDLCNIAALVPRWHKEMRCYPYLFLKGHMQSKYLKES